MLKSKIKFLWILMIALVIGNIFPIQAIFAQQQTPVFYKFFPKIDDNNVVVMVEPEETYYKFNVLFNNSQYTNIPTFERVLMELWKKDENKNLINVENKVIETDQIKRKGMVGEQPKPISPNITLIRQNYKYQDYIFFNKLAIPYYDKKVLKSTYFDIPYEEIIVKHTRKNEMHPEENQIQIIKKDYQNVTEINFNLSEPELRYFDGDGFTTYYLDFPTDNLPIEIKEALINRDNKSLFLRDNNYNRDYEFIIKNKYQFWINYQTDAPSKNYTENEAEGKVADASLKTRNSNFNKLENRFYYFSDEGGWKASDRDIRAMVTTCKEKWWMPYSWTNEELKQLLETFFDENSQRKSYGIFALRICKKDNPTFHTLQLAIKVHKNRFENWRLLLYMGFNKNMNNPAVKENETDLTTAEANKFKLNKNNTSYIVTPKDVVLFDEASQEFRDKVGEIKMHDMILLNVKESRISYKKYDPVFQTYSAPIDFNVPELFSENLTIASNVNNTFSVYSKKEERQYSFPLDMQKHPFWEYVIKLTPIYNDYYFANFRESNKCFPDLLTTNSWLINENFTSWSKEVELNIKEIMQFNNELMQYISNNQIFTDTYIYQEKQEMACNEIKNSWAHSSGIINLIDVYKNRVKATDNVKNFYNACKFLTNNGKSIKLWWPIKHTIKMDEVNKNGKVAKTFSVEVTPNQQLCENWNCTQEMNYQNTIFEGTDTKWESFKNSFQSKVIYYCLNPDKDNPSVQKKLSHFQIYKYNTLQDVKWDFTFNYNYPVETLRYYWSY